MTSIKPNIRLMTPGEIRSTKLLNAGSVIEVKGTAIPIVAGRSDQVHVFIESTVLYVLSINYRHDSIGMEVFDSASGEEYDSIFLQCQWELHDYLGKKWRELSPISIIRRLMQFVV